MPGQLYCCRRGESAFFEQAGDGLRRAAGAVDREVVACEDLRGDDGDVFGAGAERWEEDLERGDLAVEGGVEVTGNGEGAEVALRSRR